jgi:hypothetical protein
MTVVSAPRASSIQAKPSAFKVRSATRDVLRRADHLIHTQLQNSKAPNLKEKADVQH